MSQSLVRPAGETKQTPPTKSLPSLTGLRFFAAGFVVLYHFNSYIGLLPKASAFVRFGNTGVTFFFVLSGFILTWKYLDSAVPKKVYYWRRFARIWPLHVLATGLSVALFIAAEHSIGLNARWRTVSPGLLLVHAWSPDPLVIQAGSGASWSLSDEAFFYAIFPLLLVAARRVRNQRGLRFLPVTMTVVAVLLLLLVPTEGLGPWSRPVILSYIPVVRAIQFIAGIGIAVAMRRGWQTRLSPMGAIAIVVGYHLALIPWSNLTEPGTDAYPQAASQMLAIIPYALLIAAFARSDLSGRRGILHTKLARELGDASHALYLIHAPVTAFVVHALGKNETYGLIAIQWVIAFASAQTLAFLLFRFFERPIELRMRAWQERRTARRIDLR